MYVHGFACIRCASLGFHLLNPKRHPCGQFGVPYRPAAPPAAIPSLFRPVSPNVKLAIIGSGISGLSAAWLLRDRHQISLFEAADRLGGHTHTVACRHDGRDLCLETGFMVFNRVNYPLLCRLFDRLGIASQASDMSYSLSCRSCGLEYSGNGPGGVFAQGRNLFAPRFYGLLKGVVAFNGLARRLLASPGDMPATVGALETSGRLPEAVFRHYLLPMVAAIWSAPLGGVRDFPLGALLRFFANHGLLGLDTHHAWRTVVGGSSTYVSAMARDLHRVHTATPVVGLRREATAVAVRFAGGAEERFDGAVVAVHADQALRMLDDPSGAERELLGAWRYSENETLLHCDRAQLPRARRAWASWNSTVADCRATQPRASHTYWLNSLQALDAPVEYQVTLNPLQPIAEDSILARLHYRHPVFDPGSMATQSDLPRLNGVRNTWFCGAYFGFGFHEDGLRSGLDVAADLGGTL